MQFILPSESNDMPAAKWLKRRPNKIELLPAVYACEHQVFENATHGGTEDTEIVKEWKKRIFQRDNLQGLDLIDFIW